MIGDDELYQTYGTFTGYYYPMLNASRERTGKYRYPIYKKPKEFILEKTIFTRDKLDKDSAAKKEEELLEENIKNRIIQFICIKGKPCQLYYRKNNSLIYIYYFQKYINLKKMSFFL